MEDPVDPGPTANAVIIKSPYAQDAQGMFVVGYVINFYFRSYDNWIREDDFDLWVEEVRRELQEG